MLQEQWRKRCIAALLLFSMFFSTIVVPMKEVSANGSTESRLEPIYLDDSSYVEAQEVYVLPTDTGGARASFTLVVHNRGSHEIEFNDYWVRLLTKSGSSYMVQLLPVDKNKNKITAGADENFTFYTDVNSAVKVQDLIIQVFKWDFSKDDLGSTVGEIKLDDAGYTAVAQSGSKKMVYISGVRAETSVRRVLLNKNEKNTLITVYVQLVNKGDMSFEIPDYKYYIRTSEGSLYPMELSKSGKKMPIHPGESKEIQLTSSIPAAFDVSKGLELLFAQTITTTSGSVSEQIVVPIAAYELSTTKSESQTEGESVDFSTRDGIYTASLQAIQRLPWEDKDLISADLSIRNNDSRSLPIPRMTGYFMLDDKVKIEAVIVQTDDLTGFARNSEIHFQAIGKISYQSSIAKIKFVLQELDEDKATNDLAEFMHDEEISGISFLAKQNALRVNSVGRNAIYSIKDVNTYTNETSDLFITNLQMENKESRYVNAANMTAFLKDASGTLFSTSIATSSKKIIPGGKALLSVAAVVPKGMPKKGLQLLIGQSVKGDKVAVLGDAPDAFYHVAALEVPEYEKETQDILKKIDLFPYQLSLSTFTTRANLLTGDISVSFHTELSKDALFETSTEGHNLFVEIKDGKSEVSFSERVELESIDSKAPQDESKLIKLGSGKYTMRTRDEEFITQVSFSGKYQLNVYDEYKGYRRLVTSKPVSWFASLD